MDNGKTIETVWCDKKPIYFVTTKYVDSPAVTVYFNAEVK